MTDIDRIKAAFLIWCWVWLDWVNMMKRKWAPLSHSRTQTTACPFLCGVMNAGREGVRNSVLKTSLWYKQKQTPWLLACKWTIPTEHPLLVGGWVDSVPDPLLRKSGSTGNQTWDLWICGQELWPLGHRGSPSFWYVTKFPIRNSIAFMGVEPKRKMCWASINKPMKNIFHGWKVSQARNQCEASSRFAGQHTTPKHFDFSRLYCRR
jgi:hypothetical protein